MVDTIPGDISSLTTLTINGSPIESLVDTSGDHDFFRMTLTAGVTYRFTVNTSTTGTPIGDPTLTLRDAAGTSLAFNDDGGPGLYSVISFTAASSGTYFLDVAGFGSNAGGYSVSASIDDAIDDDVGTTGTIAVNAAALNGTYDTAGDDDWYGTQLLAGVTYSFDTGGAQDTTLALRDANGAQLAFDDDGGSGFLSHIQYTATASGTHFLDVEEFFDSTGAYTLVATSIDTETADNLTTGVVTVDGPTVNRYIDTSGDVDRFAVTLVEGQVYTFNTTTPTGFGNTDTIITLRDAAGVALASDDDSGPGLSSSLSFVATASGTYYVDVDGFGTATGAYALDVQRLPVFNNTQIADQLTTGFWGAGNEHHFAVSAGGSLTVNITALTAEGQSLAIAALQVWTDVTGIAFNFTAGAAQITFDDADPNSAYATANYAGGITSDAFVNVGTGWLATYGTGLNSYSFQTYIHEIGHALGLGHAGNYNGSATYSLDAHYANDSWATTVMSYFDQVDNDFFDAQGFNYTFLLTPMVADIIAIQQLYGVTNTTRTGDTVYGFGNNTGNAIYNATLYQGTAITIFDNGGTDTLDYSQYGTSYNQVVDLRSGRFGSVGGSTGNLTIARDTVIENVITGLGMDILTGNAVANVMSGGADNDEIYGQGGDDTLNGGDGDDKLNGANGNDTINGGIGIDTINGGQGRDVVDAGDGNDTVRESEVVDGGNGDDSIFGSTGFRNFFNGQAGIDFLQGAELGDVLDGGADNDVIVGGIGKDTMTGGTGADAFRFDDGEFGGATTNTADIITDFNHADGDRIRLNLVDAVNGGGDNAFSFIGTTAFGSVAGQLRYQVISGNTYVQGDTDGNGVADFMIRLNGNIALVAGDFVL